LKRGNLTIFLNNTVFLKTVINASVMRVIHFVHSFSKLSETFIYDYITALKQQGVDLRAYTLNRLNPKDRPFEPVYMIKLPLWNLSRIWNITRDLLSGKDTETSAWPAYQTKLMQLLAVDPPDVLHAHFGPMGVLLMPVARTLEIPLVVTFYGYDISKITDESYWKNAYRQLAEFASCITVLSEEMKSRALELGFSEEETKVVHLGVKLDLIKYHRSSHPIRDFISVGRLSEKKGHLDTIAAFSRVLKQTDKPLKLTIIGEGELRPKLETFVKSHHLQHDVLLPCGMPHTKVIEYLYEADAFILNSKTASDGDKEGTPTVLMEAQAAGLPCISTFHAGIPEIIPEENHCFLAEEGNIPQIVSNMQEMIAASEAETKKITRLGRDYVEEFFDVKKEAAKFKSIYEQLV
jgi:glycosyltransferase involved in cell wall biosynthesis